ncbi:arginase [Rhodohalobacter sp. SW132]|uniref:formimidoylglutamase n=1 Tax=Rhodohalobacter sp. SW132 TaxID=2293433 RepID=UPI000E23B638|nr:formimidoylglutamase [Rhodohalobacter sp. SW132]REL38820.1 arginase [Rhodohalobacter sp. SW132]
MSDKRLREFIKPGDIQTGSVYLVRFPSDEGVSRNSGRPGASEAPEQILQQLLNLTPHPAYFDRHTAFLKNVKITDSVPCSGDVEADQQALGRIVKEIFSNQSVPVILGGGHETSFGHFLGYAGAKLPVSILNIDAHADVRPLKDGLAHSGSPFRHALEHPSNYCESYSVFGLNPSSVSAEHFRYVNRHGKALFDRDLKLKAVKTYLDQYQQNMIMATMDMDVVRQADAPGVSAPNPSGISKKKWLDIAFELGKSSSVRSFDLCEVNPRFDRDQQTVKLAALTVWYFLLGLSFR